MIQEPVRWISRRGSGLAHVLGQRQGPAHVRYGACGRSVSYDGPTKKIRITLQPPDDAPTCKKCEALLSPTTVVLPKVDAARAALYLSQARNHWADGQGQALRERSGLPLREMADVVGVSASTLWRWEQGISKPTGSKAVRWVQFLEVLLKDQRGAK